MAGRLTYLNILKKTHLFTSMIILVFCLLYAITGYILIRPDWFPQGEATDIKKVFPLRETFDTSNTESFAKTLKNKYLIKGRVRDISKRKDSTWVYLINRPGLSHEIIIHKNFDSLTIIRSEQFTVGRIASRLHKLRHFEGGWKYTLWAILYDISALSFIIYAITGILIWFRNRKTLSFGWFILLPVTAFGVLVLYYLL